MIGKKTSKPNQRQKQRAAFLALRDIVWRLTDSVVSKVTGAPADEDEDNLSGGLKRPDITTCTFHVFFLSIGETEEQIERLRNEPIQRIYSPKRSRLVSKLKTAFVKPINATAAKVSPGDAS